MTIELGPGEAKQLDVLLTPLPMEPATLHGSVTDAANPGIGIEGAIVAIVGTGGTYQATTGSTGLYEITGIEPGIYEGSVTHPDYETAYF